ncbi:MAG TPA: MFS transporter [Polyangiaceae bacterium]
MSPSPDLLRSLRGWAPTASMMLVSLVSYIDRNTLALLAPTLLAELHLSAEDYGWMISCFSVAYTIGNPVWGRVLDRMGLRYGMLFAVAVWSVASTSHAFVSTFAGFALARALLGFGEGATFPGGLRAATQTLPPAKRARGVAIAYSGGSLGAILTPLVVTPIAVAYGWRGAFVCTGLLGATWLAAWAAISRDLPSPNEQEAIEEHRESRRVRLSEPRLWAFIAAYALGAMPLGFVLYGAPIYLSGALGQSQVALGKLLWLPPLGWEVGYFFWGWWMDRLAKRPEGPDGAFPKVFAGLTLLGTPLALAPAIPAVAPVLALFVLATFAAAGFVIAGLAYAARVFSMRDAGLIAGVGAGSWSAVVAVVMPGFGRLFDHHSFGAAFALSAAAPILGLVLWMAIDRASPRSPTPSLESEREAAT